MTCISRPLQLGCGVTTLLLMLYCAGCATYQPVASVHQGPLGNAVLVTVPAGTLLQLPNAPAAQNVSQALANEVRGAASNSVTTIVPLKLCTPVYLIERDQAEMLLHKRIQALEVENQALRLK